MKYIINVEQNHIDAGVPGCPSNCPVALAIQEQTGLEASVTGHVAFFRAPDGHPDFPEGWRAVVELPKAVSEFAWYFDARIGSSPFSFLLDTENIATGWEWR